MDIPGQKHTCALLMAHSPSVPDALAGAACAGEGKTGGLRYCALSSFIYTSTSTTRCFHGNAAASSAWAVLSSAPSVCARGDAVTAARTTCFSIVVDSSHELAVALPPPADPGVDFSASTKRCSFGSHSCPLRSIGMVCVHARTGHIWLPTTVAMRASSGPAANSCDHIDALRTNTAARLNR